MRLIPHVILLFLITGCACVSNVVDQQEVISLIERTSSQSEKRDKESIDLISSNRDKTSEKLVALEKHIQELSKQQNDESKNIKTISDLVFRYEEKLKNMEKDISSIIQNNIENRELILNHQKEFVVELRNQITAFNNRSYDLIQNTRNFSKYVHQNKYYYCEPVYSELDKYFTSNAGQEILSILSIALVDAQRKKNDCNSKSTFR